MPQSTLSKPSENENRPNRFILFSDSWLNLQNYITSCLDLPINQGDFVTKYGTFSDLSKVNNVVTALKNVKALTSEFGDPSTVKSKIATTGGSYLLTSQPPDEIYAHIIWLAMQIQGAASTFNNTFASVKDLLNPSVGTKDERASYLKEVLIGRGGLVSTAEDMKAKTAALLSKLATFDGKVTDANIQVVKYTSQQSDIMKAANALVAEFTKNIEEFQTQSEAAEKAWRDYTIAACVTSVGLAILSCVLLVLAPFTFGTTAAIAGGLAVGAVAAAGALGNAAKRQRDEYDRLLGEIKKTEADKQLKVQLVSDLTALNSQVTLVGTGLSDFKTNLGVIEGVWTDIGGKLAYLCTNYTPAQLSDYSFIVQTTKILDAQTKWKEIADVSTEFTQYSLVDYKRGKFGDAVNVDAVAA
jgi:hypothetical protein